MSPASGQPINVRSEVVVKAGAELQVTESAEAGLRLRR